MKRPHIIALALFATATLSALYFLFRSPAASPADPVVKGRPVSVWARDGVLSNSWETVEQLRKIGTPAVPFVLPYLDKRDSVFNSARVTIQSHLPAFAQKWLPPAVLSRDLRMNAVVILREMGPPAAAAVPALIRRLADPDGTVSLHSAIALGNIGPAAREALPGLRPFLSSSKHTVRVYTAEAVWKIDHDPSEVLPVLEAGIQDTSASFRWAAAVFLGELGPAATNAIPLLQQAARSPDKETASCAVQALAEISPETVPILIEVLGDPDPAMRMSACVALGKIGPKAVAAIPVLKSLLSDQNTGMPTIMGRTVQPVKVCVEAAAALKRIENTKPNSP